MFDSLSTIERQVVGSDNSNNTPGGIQWRVHALISAKIGT